MRVLVFSAALLFSACLFAQSDTVFKKQFLPGFQLKTGISLVNLTETTAMPVPIDLESGFSFGFAFTGDLMLKDDQGVNFGLGASQVRSIIVDDYEPKNLPRYEFNYWDFSARYYLRMRKPGSRIHFTNGFGASAGYMFSGWRVYETGADLINEDTRAWDFGLSFESALQLELKRKDFIKGSISAYYGFGNVFSGVLEADGMKGNNLTVMLGVNYILGKRG